MMNSINIEERDVELESLKASLVSSKIEAKQAAERFEVVKNSHLQLLKDKSLEKKINVVRAVFAHLSHMMCTSYIFID